MKNYTTENPSFRMVITLPEEMDPAHADIISEAPKQLLGNTLVLKNEQDIHKAKISKIEETARGLDENVTQSLAAVITTVSLMQNAAVDQTSSNMAVEVFDDTSGYVILRGQYDAEKKRLYA